MAKAKKLPSGSWRVLAYVGKNDSGKRQYKSFVADSKKEAEYLASEFIYKQKQENVSDKLTFQIASDRYLEEKKNVLSPSTIYGYRIMQRNAFPLLLSAKLGDLSVNNVIQNQMNQNALHYSSKSLHNQYGFISAVMGYFHYSLSGARLKPLEDKAIPVPTKSEINKILELLAGSEIECQALLALTCSLRQSEILALTPDNIDGNVVKVHGARVPDENGKLVYKETNKSKAGTRETIMPTRLKELMEEKCNEAKASGAEWIFTSHSNVVRKHLQNLLKANGLPPYTMHALRHAFAALMHEQGVPDKYVMEMGGWSSDYVLKKTYQYAFSDETKRIKEKANEFFEKAMQHEMQHE